MGKNFETSKIGREIWEKCGGWRSYPSSYKYCGDFGSICRSRGGERIDTNFGISHKKCGRSRNSRWSCHSLYARKMDMSKICSKSFEKIVKKKKKKKKRGPPEKKKKKKKKK